MRAVVVHEFGSTPTLETVPDPACPADGVVVAVEATGLCRSDWHAWIGHEPDIALPHVPGHELAGTVVASGPAVNGWAVGDRVTTPFVLACGACRSCADGDQQVCERQLQPGFTQWGSFAELVARVRAGERVVVHGCGGVGLSAVMVAVARGARVYAVDVADASLALAASLGATPVHARDLASLPDLTDGGAHVSLDALGSSATFAASVACLRPRGRHVQVGLLLGADATPAVAMGRVVAQELQLLGSHGMSAASYPELLGLVSDGVLDPARLLRERIDLAQAPARLAALGEPGAGVGGITVIRP